MSLLKLLRNSFAWVLIRYQKSYGLLGSFLSAFNFAGILTLLVQPYFDIPTFVILPLVFVVGIIILLTMGILLYDKGNFQTVMAQKDGILSEYWHKRLTPLNVKSMTLNVEMHRAMIKGDLKELDRIEKIIKSGVLQ
jgi:hypothetical protein